MRIISWAVLFMFSGGVAAAQALFPVSNGVTGMGITGAPYSARETVVRIQISPAGQKYATTDVSLVWRDAEGRTHEERLPASGKNHVVDVTDPVAGVRMVWIVGPNPRSNQVTIMPLPSQPKMGPPRMIPLRAGSCGNSCTREMLDGQQINGVNAQGLRTTNLVTLGTDENGRRVTGQYFSEMWVSPDLGIVVREVVNSPKSGRALTELTEVVPGVPDPTLFQLPAGYEVRDVRQRASAAP
jgi:hypothetical protein